MADARAGEGRASGGWDAHVHVFDDQAPVRTGHYRPQTHALKDIEALGAAHGLSHLVLVQPSVYGTDHRVLLQALRQAPGRHRGIAVVDASVDEAELDLLHDAGVCGVRFNKVSPVGNDDHALMALAPRLRDRGWHVQWYVQPTQLPRLVQLQRTTGLVFVLDHLAGFGLDAPAPTDCWHALTELAQEGAWLKLSGWYRLGDQPPYSAMVPLIQRASAPFEDRLVWGSDWPHTSLPDPGAARHASLLEPVRQALGQAVLAGALHTHPLRLYGLHSPQQALPAASLCP